MSKPILSQNFDWTKPVPIVALLDLDFNIPTYQRGYRWSETQVDDLLNDIQDYIVSFHGKGIGNDDFYSLQPIVVKWNEQRQKWNLIDGQQRMTTIFLVIKYFNCISGNTPLPRIEYETRDRSKTFLHGMTIDTKNVTALPQSTDENNIMISNDDNIDYKYMSRVFKAIHEWFSTKDSSFNSFMFQGTFLHNMRVIWYELPDNEDETESFTRLNLGKIPLTNAELIKALFLNSSNFKSESTNTNEVKLEQIKIAAEWDKIENTLCNDEFWLFLHEREYDKPNRIDFIFQLIEQSNALKIKVIKDLGNDEYRTFRYFSEFFTQTKDNAKDYSVVIKENWKKVKKYFQIFEEWFNNLEIYHYVGYITETKGSQKVSELVDLWDESKNTQEFIGKLKKYIKKNILRTVNLDQQYEISYLDDQGNTKYYSKKTTVKPILLLHNILTVINQNRHLKNKDEYDGRVYYKFPFHLYKKEKWDVEHIDSNTTNTLSDLASQKEWVANTFELVDTSNAQLKQLRKKVKEFVCLSDKTDEEIFSPLFTTLQEQLLECVDSVGLNSDKIKNQIGNFTLLDARTNRSYGNALFPTKRRFIIGKDQGIRYSVKYDKSLDKGYQIEESHGEIAFVPPVTRQIFLKYYSIVPNSNISWNEVDFVGYKQNIYRLLKEENFL